MVASASPTTESEAGSVASVRVGAMWMLTIPLMNTIIGLADEANARPAVRSGTLRVGYWVCTAWIIPAARRPAVVCIDRIPSVSYSCNISARQTLKLVFYSDQLIPGNRRVYLRLLDLLGKSHPRLGYIPAEGDPQRRYYQDRIEWYAYWGISLPVYFELDRDYRPERLEELWSCDAIHLSGGNTYYFLHWLRKRELLEPLRNYVASGGVLIGVSAGGILLTPEIDVSGLLGDHPLAEQDDLTALSLVDFSFAPHLNSLRDTRPLKEYARRTGRPVYGCRDGDGILVDGPRVEFIGQIVEF